MVLEEHCTVYMAELTINLPELTHDSQRLVTGFMILLKTVDLAHDSQRPETLVMTLTSKTGDWTHDSHLRDWRLNSNLCKVNI